MKQFLLSILFVSFFINPILSQDRKDKGVFLENKNETWDQIRKEIDEFEKKAETKKQRFTPDFTKIQKPNSISDFKTQWHNDPVMQSSTGTCWCFCGTSFLESDIYRQNGLKIKISEMHTVYYEYIEKVKRFVRMHGDSYVSEGSQANAVTRIWKEYGCVPVDVYTGKKEGQKHHEHSKLVKEINTYLDFCKKNNIWDEKQIIDNVKSILNYYLGEPPTDFTYQGKKYTPVEFLKNVIKVNLDDYVDYMSLMEFEYNKSAVYDVPDNWWKGEFRNVSLDDYINSIKKAVKNGFTLAIGGDVSEAGLYSYEDAAIVPSFDIPSSYIDENARQFRYSNGTTGDDHGIHIVGYTEINGVTWFLIKDSGSGARNGKMKGYYMYHEDYVKLKMINIMIHKDAVPELNKNFK